MDLRHLRAFITVAEERNLTRAATRLHICQPPLSRQIRQLEDELGVALFVRRHDGVRLTQAGRALLPKAKALISGAAELATSAALHGQNEPGNLKIGFAWGLWEAVNRVRCHHAKRFPAVAIEGDALTSSRLNEAVIGRKIDIGFLRSPVTAATLHSIPLFEERFVVLLAEANPLARRKSLRIKDLANQPLLLYARDGRSGVYDKTLALYARAGIAPTVIDTPHGPADQAAIVPVACGKGIFLALSSPLTLSHRAGGVAVVPLNEPDATIVVNAAWRKGETSRAVLQFVHSVREVFSPD